jgi:hypothetical protein
MANDRGKLNPLEKTGVHKNGKINFGITLLYYV